MTPDLAVLILLMAAAISLGRPVARITGLRNWMIDVPEDEGRVDVYFDDYIYSPLYRSHSGNLSITLTTNANGTLNLPPCVISYTRYDDSCKSGNLSIYITPRGLQMNLRGVHRHMGGMLAISFTSDSITKADGILNIYQVPTVVNCTVVTDRSNWSAALSCEVLHAYSTADLYTVQVHEAFVTSDCNTTDRWVTYCLQFQQFRGYAVSQPRSEPGNCEHHHNMSFQHNLTAYTNSTNSKLYYRGRLFVSWPRSAFSARRWMISAYVCCGSVRSTCVQVEHTFNYSTLYRPSSPTNNCTGMEYLPYTSHTGCRCSADYLGEPPGRLVWLQGNTVLLAGQYGARQLTLTPSSMKPNQQVVQCQVDWIEPVPATPALPLAYGPDSVQLRIYQQPHTENTSGAVIIDCQIMELNPRTPNMAQWTGPCQGQQGFTCILDPKFTEVQGQNVTCRVTNVANMGYSVVAAIWVDLTVPVCSDHKWAAIGGAVVLGVGVVIALIVLAVLNIYRRYLLCCEPVYDSTKPAGTVKAETDQHLYEVVCSDRSRGGPSQKTAAQSSDVYENTSFSPQ